MSKFCSVILALAFAILAYANQDHDLKDLEDKFVKNLDTCVNKTKATGVQLDELGRFRIPTETPPMCFLACIAKNLNVMDDNNKFSKTEIKNIIKPILEQLKKGKMENEAKKIMDIINKCVDEQTEEKDECVAAKNAMECVVTHGKQAGILE